MNGPMNATLRHIVSATEIENGQRLAMCGVVFANYESAKANGPVGNYLTRKPTLSAYHAAGVDCESCIVRHMGAVAA